METLTVKDTIEILFALITTYIGYKAKDLLIWIKNRRFRLDQHELFIEILAALNEIRSWRVPENRQVFRDALRIKLKCWHDLGIKFAKEVDNRPMSPFAIEKKTMEWMSEVIEAYNKEWQNAGIPQIIIDKINQRHQRKIDMFTAAFQKIAHNDVYITNKHKFIAIFDKLLTLLIETKLEFYDLIYGQVFNGELKGVRYKGIPLHEDEFKYWKAKANKAKDIDA